MRQTFCSRIAGPAALVCAATWAFATPSQAADFKILQPLHDKPTHMKKGALPWDGYYVPSTPDTVMWGSLPNANTKPVLSVPSGSVVTFDTVSHEGVLEDQGKDPVKYFGQFGVKPEQVLKDAQAIAASSLEHDFVKDGPHVVTGPVEVKSAKAGDVLMVEMLSLQPRVPYGVISNRHGKGALPGEFPENKGPQPGADAAHPDLYANVWTFVPIRQINRKWYGIVKDKGGLEARIPLKPFNGTMGVAVNTQDKPNSIPPGVYAGNLDVNDLSVGAVLYIPVQVDGALFYASDPHFAQGDGEVALTAIEGSLRSTYRLTVLKAGDRRLPMKAPMKNPFAETPDHWIPIGLNTDLNEAMKDATRQTVQFLNEKLGMDRATALAYASAAVDFQVTQVVDRVKGVNAIIRKSDFVAARGAKAAKK
ncbi:MAG TPA: acetamidase/formamidase family protein [Burkholderiales bacterium]|nr:acetamidase/formamidase family protein [Burkholderiales bacterium]